MKNNKKYRACALIVSLALAIVTPTAVFATGPSAVNLGTAGDFVILTKTGISTTGTTAIVGNIGVSPAQATYITGFGLVLPVASAFSTSAVVNGKVYAPGYAVPTPTYMTTAVSDMETAYTDAGGRTNPTATELGAGNIGGMTLAPGLYKWGTGVTIPSDVTLSGRSNDVWIFQIAQGLTVASGAKVILAGGAQASNIFWVVAGEAILNTTSVFNGNILGKTAIILKTGATLNGRALAQAAVTLDASTVTIPSGVAVTASPTPTPVPTPTPAPVIVVTSASNNNSGGGSGGSGVSSTATVTTSATESGVDMGCFSGNKFSVVTGRNCNSVMSGGGNMMVDRGCFIGNKFSIATGQVCSSFMPTPDVDLGCSTGSKFSITTGRNCNSVVSRAMSSSSVGARIRMIAVNMGKGSRGDDVKTLQEFLIEQNKGPVAQELKRVGATSSFGSITRAALAEFQASAGITPALGNFGGKTREYMNAHY